jgi:hypothetical protein
MLWEAVPTAIVAGFTPTTLLIVAGVLSRERPMRNALVVLLTATAVTLLVGILVVEALGSTNVEDRHRHHSVSPAIDLGLGLAILLLVPYLVRRATGTPRPPGGLRKRLRARRERSEQRKARKRRHGNAGLVAVIGLGLFVGSPSPLYLASLHSVSKGRPDAAVGVLDVLLLAALVLLMAWVPIILFALAPERATALLRNANAWLARHGRVLVVVAVTGIGCYFTVNGLAHLL